MLQFKYMHAVQGYYYITTTLHVLVMVIIAPNSKNSLCHYLQKLFPSIYKWARASGSGNVPFMVLGFLIRILFRTSE